MHGDGVKDRLAVVVVEWDVGGGGFWAEVSWGLGGGRCEALRVQGV